MREQILHYIYKHKPSALKLMYAFGEKTAIEWLFELQNRGEIVRRDDGVWPWYEVAEAIRGELEGEDQARRMREQNEFWAKILVNSPPSTDAE